MSPLARRFSDIGAAIWSLLGEKRKSKPAPKMTLLTQRDTLRCSIAALRKAQPRRWAGPRLPRAIAGCLLQRRRPREAGAGRADNAVVAIR